MEDHTIAVLVVEDHPLLLEGIRNLVGHAGLAVRGVAADCAGAEALLAEQSLEDLAAIIDIQLPDGSGLDVVRRWAPRGLRALVFTGEVSGQAVRDSLSAGASGFIAKTASPGLLVEGIRAVARGESFLCPLGRQVLAGLEAAPTLTPRETEILRHIAGGLSNKEIAAGLGVAPRTVESHRERLLAKLDAHNAADLTREAIRRGLLARTG